MNKQLNLALWLSLSLLLRCDADDEHTAHANDLISAFNIDGGQPYATPNGYFEEYLSNGKVAWYALQFIDGEFTAIVDMQTRPCPFARNLNHGVTIHLRLNHDQKLVEGFYNYATNSSSLGIIDDSMVFYNFEFTDDCFGAGNVSFKIVDGTLQIEKSDNAYAISYTLIDDTGKKIEGSYFGTLINRAIPE